MNSKAIIGLVVAGVVLVGGIFAFAGRSSDNTDTVASNDTQQTNDDSQEAVAANGLSNDNGFPAELSIVGSYVATITSRDTADPSNNADLELIYNNENLWQTSIDSSEGGITTIYTGDATYIEGPTGWTKFPVSDAGASGAIEGFTFSDSDIEEFRTKAIDAGTESCSLGTCRVWEITDNDDGSTGKIWVADDGRLARAIVSQGSTTTELEYDYNADTTVTVPKNFQEFTVPTENDLDLESIIPN